ncbi:hypothetical protein GRI75_14115 [Altererythrobacter soli]|uniref:Uncharacterized protein n=1 Tax=Croceibacterium soli TaxID=1739690 RepID=A0A6I4UZX4_9SPHN|nr:hypothetical protein [Croceibacterium soli]MXP42777.1 hypothetical protein [Croceibacterium soli]
MEYEIEDEDRLFDPSTNPSLAHRHLRSPQSRPARTVGYADSREARRVQKAVLIPEEEQQPA